MGNVKNFHFRERSTILKLYATLGLLKELLLVQGVM